MNRDTAAWSEAERRLLADAETRAEFEALEDRYQLVKKLIVMREGEGWTQAQLAKRMSVTQGRVAQMESLSSRALPSLSSIRRYASACGHRAVVDFEPVEDAQQRLRQVAETRGDFRR